MRVLAWSKACFWAFGRFARFASVFLVLQMSLARAEELTEAPHALLVDLEADAVLFAKGADAPFQPASLAKLMTMVVVFDELRAGRLTLEDTATVSEHAWRRGGAPSRTSAMFAAVRSQVPVADLIRGAIVQGGNDAAIVLAEKISGSEQAFAQRMNERAKQLGMTRSVFRNPTGLPEAGQQVTAKDLVTLARAIIEDYPEFYPIYAEPEFTWHKIRQLNRNPLLSAVAGADGLATGYSEESGYHLVGSVRRAGRRLLLVLGGEKSEKARTENARKLIDWGYDSFDARPLFAIGETVTEAKVFGGVRGSVPLLSERAVALLAPRGDDSRIVARVVYKGPLRAPIAKGTPAGTLKVWRGQTLTLEVPLKTGLAVERGGLAIRAFDGAAELVRTGFQALMAKI